MGRIQAVFKADGAETGGSYSISEWWLDPRTKGPGTHSHPYDHAYYVLAGVMSVRIGEEWKDCSRGSFILIPGGVPHDFENRGDERAGILSFNDEAGFEGEMEGIAAWFAENPPGDAG